MCDVYVPAASEVKPMCCHRAMVSTMCRLASYNSPPSPPPLCRRRAFSLHNPCRKRLHERFLYIGP